MQSKKFENIRYGHTKHHQTDHHHMDHQLDLDGIEYEDRIIVTREGHVSSRQRVDGLYLTDNFISAIKRRRRSLWRLKKKLHKMKTRELIREYRDMLYTAEKEPDRVPLSFEMVKKELERRNPAELRRLERAHPRAS